MLKAVLQRARRSPFYGNRLSGVSTWKDVPITTKNDLRLAYPFGFLAIPRTQIATYHESSGSEGSPISSYFSESDWKDIESRFRRNAVQLRQEDVFFIKTPYSMVTTAHQAHRAAHAVGAMIIPGDNRTSMMPYSRVVELLNSIGVTVTWSLPTETLLWKLIAEAQGLKHEAFSSLRAFWVAGEVLSPSKKRCIQSLWKNVRVFEDYGSTETGSLGGECRAGAIHLWSDRIHFEVLAENRISPTGRGNLLVTPLFREAMPLLRYLIEDEVEVLESECACGSTFPTIRILGRTSQRIHIADQALFPLQIEDAVYSTLEPLGIVLWRGIHSRNSLKIEFCGIGDKQFSLVLFERRLSNDLNISVSLEQKPVADFVDPKLFSEKLSFSKPRFLFRQEEKCNTHYYRTH